MRLLFLTSSLGTNKKIDGVRIPCKMDNSNKFIDLLNDALVSRKKLVFISSNPHDYERNDEAYSISKESFMMSGFNFQEVINLDKRNMSEAANIIKDSDLVILCGGHVPTQNDWFKEINLKQLLDDYEGIIVGSSAGSMNAAEIVYCPPELEGEAINPNFNKWMEGLGLTDINIFPHYSELINEEIDGFKTIDDIVLKDSFKHPIYALNDSSFIVINNREATVHGDCFRIHNGEITTICENHKSNKLI